MQTVTTRLAVFFAVPILLVGCTVPEAALRYSAEFEYFRRGGLCATDDGGALCELRILIRDDGTWSATGIPDVTGGDNIPPGAASELLSVFGQSWPVFQEEPFLGTCPMAYDGQEYGYVAREIPFGPGAENADARIREARSCLYDMERYDSLVKRNQIHVAWRAIRPPELEEVEFR